MKHIDDPLIAPGRVRLRELGISIGNFSPGKWNAITDVPGIKIGHTTLITDDKEGLPVRTGVTAILPNDNIYMNRLNAGAFVLNGAGEMSGLIQVQEWGILETPILLSNTYSVGVCSSALVKDLTKRHPGIGEKYDVVIPVVGECDDSWLNDIRGMHVRSEHVYHALAKAQSGPVAEGSVGGGTGMITCDFKAGIGTSSRLLDGKLQAYTLGVLVMSNFGIREELRIDGVPVGKMLFNKFSHLQRRTNSYGSIIAVLATNAPLTAHQLNRVSKRVALGIGRVGSHAAHGSGEIVIAFSTANKIPRSSDAPIFAMNAVLDSAVNPIYQAAIEATEEAIINSLCASSDMKGRGNKLCPALPLDDIKKIFSERSSLGE
ncbi:MAG: P1 family peptidase [Oligoflexia bacterium]|nr:P1 family peptidase [Oligoflexia bacterium]